MYHPVKYSCTVAITVYVYMCSFPCLTALECVCALRFFCTETTSPSIPASACQRRWRRRPHVHQVQAVLPPAKGSAIFFFFFSLVLPYLLVSFWHLHLHCSCRIIPPRYRLKRLQLTSQRHSPFGVHVHISFFHRLLFKAKGITNTTTSRLVLILQT